MIKIEDELKNDFLDYATSVNTERSFPDSRDGLKISQRAILWEMYNSKCLNSKPHVKCAKITGACIGRWHPHGDSSAYEALVHMSQFWTEHKNTMEIDFHGAMGSLAGGDCPASSRYTEARLSKFSEDCFFTNINKNTVDFIDNFSEDEQWPSVFPALAPRLLLNASSGIGYTIAQDWLPHNLNEVFEKIKEYIATGKVTSENIYPDFEVGGIIINKSALHTIYETGRGSVILRGKAEINGKYINITELPYQVYAEPFIQKIKDLVNAEQLIGIEDICNKSGDDCGMLIEIECSVDPNIILNKLYKLTDLQITLSANQMALVDGIPQMLNLENYLKVYIDHNLTCLQREYTFDLNKATERLEIVDGLIKAMSIIDEVIKVIRASKSSEASKADLINQFNFTNNQAKAIVDMRLGKLANLEVNELNDEKIELDKVIDKCNKFLASDKLQKKEFLKRLTDFVDKYGWERRTKVCDIDLDAENALMREHDKKSEEKFRIILENNCLKKVAVNSYKVKDDNSIEVGAKDKIIAISSTGKMYKLLVKDINQCSQNSTGTPVSNLCNDNIIAIYSGTEEEKYLIFITKNGLIKKADAQEIFGLSKNVGAPVCKVLDDDSIIKVILTTQSTIKLINGSKSKVINTDDLLCKGRTAGGIVAIKLKKNTTLTTNDIEIKKNSN